MPKLNIDRFRQPEFLHRSGWAFALNAISSLHVESGVLFDSFLERTFCWHETNERNAGKIPYRQPWVGVLHNPPGIPHWHDIHNSPETVLKKESFQKSLPYCLGLFVLSDYLKNWLITRVDCPVSTLRHPTEIPELRFDPKLYLQQQKPCVIHVGWWLRNMSSFCKLHASNHRKILLQVPHSHFETVYSRDLAINQVTDSEKSSVERIKFLDNQAFDALLSSSIVFCDLYDSSANNTIIECIVRGTPLLVNPIPAVREYLGDRYPLYFRSLKEAERKLKSVDLIFETHQYISSIPKHDFSKEHFRDQVVNSTVYKSIKKSTLES